MDKKERYFGRIIFPDSNKVVQSVWLTLEERKFYIELEDPDLGVEDWAIVWGEFNKLGRVSLLDCALTSMVNGFGGIERKLFVSHVVQGVKLDKRDQAFISKVRFESGGLNEWIYTDDRIEYDGGYKLPASDVILNIVLKEYTISFTVDYVTIHNRHSVFLKRVTFVDIEFTEPKTFYEFYALREKIEKLIVFLTNEKPSLSIPKYNRTHFELFMTGRNWEAHRFSAIIDCRYEIIKNELRTIVEVWLLNQKIEPILNLILERKENPGLSVPRYFLNMCVATESYHKKFVKNKVELVDQTLLTNRERIKEMLKHDLVLLDWFRSKSEFLKNPQLIDRLMHLKSEFSAIVGDVFNSEIEEVLRRIKNTRNKLAHEGRHDTEFKSELELFIAAYSLEMMLYCLLLLRLGIKEEMKDKLVKNGYENVQAMAQINNFKGL